MGQELNFYLQKKDSPNDRITLGWYYTTVARTLSNENIFPYTGEKNKLLDSDTYAFCIRNLEEFIKYLEKNKNQSLQEEKKWQSFLIQSSTDNFELIYDKLICAEQSTAEYSEELELYQNIAKNIQLFKNISDMNSNYELYYYNA